MHRKFYPQTTVGVIYRHGGPSLTFTTHLDRLVSKLNREKSKFYIFGDYNLNLFKIDELPNISEFVNCMHSQNALNMINIATRFPIGNQLGRPSLLDHLWTNEPLRVKSIDLIVDPISDHRPILVVLKMNKYLTQPKPNNFFIRDLSLKAK